MPVDLARLAPSTYDSPPIERTAGRLPSTRKGVPEGRYGDLEQDSQQVMSVPFYGSIPPRSILIEPPRRMPRLDFVSLWDYRELLYFLTWRDIKVRYKQTVLGAAWAILQPLATMAIFTIFFGRLAGMQSDGLPYPVFSFAALLVWMFFANGMSQAANSLVGNANLITKVYFPRLLVPLANVLSGLIDLGLGSIVLAGLMLWHGLTPSWRLLALPLPLALVLLTTFGAGVWLAALNVQFRDVRYVVPFLTQLWLFASPVVYPATLLDARWRMLYGLNPMAGAIEGWRWCVLGTEAVSPAMLCISLAVALALAASGMAYFRLMERTFADLV